ncbi:MAG: hypothetical protein K9I29_09170 [Bacteroidales bacterium]|nr:hypothetical protein [Bacteroidales bacterium]MCF8328448.1 hypothetical protein [Bacteroidales bacterium]
MLRKTLHIIMTALLLAATTGFTVSKHYCENTLVSYSLYTEAEACCEDISDECCHDVSEHLQVDQEFVTTSFSLGKDTFLTSKFIQSSISFLKRESSSGKITVTENSFPHKTHLPLVRLQKFLL